MVGGILHVVLDKRYWAVGGILQVVLRKGCWAAGGILQVVLGMCWAADKAVVPHMSRSHTEG